mgnify:CR=1 FL=1
MEKKDQSLRNRAFRLLARREYGRVELSRLLSEHAESPEALTSLLDQLVDDGYQSDERFVESFVRSRVSQGKGTNRIRNELQQRGVSAELVADKMTSAEVDWFELAKAQRVKKFGREAAKDAKLKAKYMRFLLYRGFTQEQCRYAIEDTQ